MIQFKEEILTDNIVVHCDTEEKAIDLLKWADSYGKTWHGGQSYLNNLLWDIHEAETCYRVNEGDYGTTSGYYKELNCKIISYEEAVDEVKVKFKDFVLTENIVVHCDTEEKAKNLLDWAAGSQEVGLEATWRSGGSYSNNARWGMHKESSCYSLRYSWEVRSLEWYENRGDIIISYEEALIDEPAASESNAVNHPSHYNGGDIECIDAIKSALTEEEFRGFIKGNVLKYTWREKHKNGDQDLDKASWYLGKR